MLIRDTIFFLPLFFFASSAPSQLNVLINGALAEPQLLAHLPLEITFIMRAIVPRAHYTAISALLPFITEGRLFTDAHSDKSDPIFWRSLVNNALYRLVQKDKRQAQFLVDQIAIPRHPFAIILQGLFTSECPLNKEFLTLTLQGLSTPVCLLNKGFLTITSVFDEVLRPVFNQSCVRIFASRRHSQGCTLFNRLLRPHPNRKDEFLELLGRYEQTIMWRHDRKSHACAFLRKIDFKILKHAARQLGEHYDFYCDMDRFAAFVYQQLSLSAPQDASAALGSIMPHVYDTLQDRSYSAVIMAYQISQGQLSRAEQLRQYVSEALQTKRLVETLPGEFLALLRALHQDTPLSRPLFRHISQSDLVDRAASLGETEGFWDFLINNGLLGYSKYEANHADLQELIKSILIPSNPLLSHFKNINLGAPRQPDLQFSPETASFTSGPSAKLQYHFDQSSDLDVSEEVSEFVEGRFHLGDFVTGVSKKAFQEVFSAIVVDPPPADATLRFTFLMHKYSQAMSWHRPSHRYHYAFLINAGFEHFKFAKACYQGHHECFLEDPAKFALFLYNTINLGPPEEAQKVLKALRKIDRKTYNKSIEKDYVGFINACVESVVELVGLERLEECVAEILASPEIMEDLSLEQQSILRGLQGGSTTYNPLFSYIFDNYKLPSVDAKDRMLFWRSLLFSSVHKFAQKFPELAQKVTNLQIVPFDPFCTEASQTTPVFSQGLINIADPKPSFYKAAEWGHVHTVALLIEWHHPITDYDVGYAFLHAARNGYNDMITFLFKKYQEIPFINTIAVFNEAAKYGHNDTIVLLFEQQPIIGRLDLNDALCSAARNGDNDMILLLLKKSHRTFDGSFDSAFKIAAGCGHNDTMDLLFEKGYDNLTGNSIFEALHNAASSGHNHTVSFMLKKILNITDLQLSAVLISALDNGHSDTAALILKNHPEVTSHSLKYCFRNAAYRGDNSTMALILENLHNISARRICEAVLYAARNGHNGTMLFMFQQRFKSTTTPFFKHQLNITASHVEGVLFHVFYSGRYDTILFIFEQWPQITIYSAAKVLCYAAANGEDNMILFLLQKRPDITADHAGKALCRAASNGKNRTIQLFLEERPDITADHAGKALCSAGSHGQNHTIQLLLEKRPDITTKHLSEALQDAARNGCNNTIRILFKKRPDISAHHAGKALRAAADRGNNSTILLLFEKRHRITDRHHREAIAYAHGSGFSLTATLIEDHMNGIASH